MFFSCFIGSEHVWAESWVIIADSPVAQILLAREGLPGRKVIVLDGAANRIYEQNLKNAKPWYPDVLLGDFDSIQNKGYWGIKATFSEIDNNSLSYKGNFGVEIVPAKNQDLTDLEKGILYADRHGASSIVIINAVGGRTDHTLASFGNLRKYHKTERALAIYTNEEIIEYVRDKTIVLDGNIGDRCAIMGYPQATITTRGLVFNGTNYPLDLGISESVCNSLADQHAEITIKGESLVISALTVKRSYSSHNN